MPFDAGEPTSMRKVLNELLGVVAPPHVKADGADNDSNNKPVDLVHREGRFDVAFFHSSLSVEDVVKEQPNGFKDPQDRSTIVPIKRQRLSFHSFQLLHYRRVSYHNRSYKSIEDHALGV